MSVICSRSITKRSTETHLGDTEVCEDDAAGTSRTPDEEHLDLEASRASLGVDKVGSGITNTEVPEPVAGDGEGHGLGTDLEREDFSSDDPSNRSPGGGEECLR